jgi:ParB-like chromosome segregation protein Spo0J
MDETVTTEIMMGVLTSSHARALVKLPRGNQGDVARVISTHGLSSRQSDALAEALLKASDEGHRQRILADPEAVIGERPTEEAFYDGRLSGYGNSLVQSAGYALKSLQILLSRLEDHRLGMLSETELVIITPELQKVSGYAGRLIEQITKHTTIKTE